MAVRCRVRVLQGPRRLLQHRSEVLLARVALRRVKDEHLAGGADNLPVVQLRGHDAGDPVGERADPVHEVPEAGQSGARLQHAAEDGAHHGQEGDDAAGRLRVGHGDDGHVGKDAAVQEELHDEQQDQALPVRRLVRAHDGEVEAGVREHGADDLERELDDHVGEQEGLPRVGLAGTLADFVQLALRDEQWLDLCFS